MGMRFLAVVIFTATFPSAPYGSLELGNLESRPTNHSATTAPGNTSRPEPVDTDVADYIWPTDASYRITSSFAEYRTMHFHGGIDISTNGVTGYKVFAVRDGYVYRIRIMPNGYGKMLYVKHRDGYVSTYAHLKGFNEDITRIARAIQYDRGTYSIDTVLAPDVLPVKKGETIAYTGDTGVGPPHLHFELRDENLDLVNPFFLPNFLMEDKVSPQITRMMVAPLDHGSTVDKSSSPKYLSRFPRGKDGLTVPGKLIIHGRVGFSVEAHDRMDGVAGRAGVHSMEFYLDDSLYFAMRLDRVPADETKQICLHYEYPAIVQGWGKFQKLYVEEGNSLPLYEMRPPGTGIVNTELLPEGQHNYRIICKDFHGNRTQISGTLVINRTPTFRIEHADRKSITISGASLDLVDKFLVYGRTVANITWTPSTISKKRFQHTNDMVGLPVNLEPYDILKVVAETRFGTQTAPVFYFHRKPSEPLRTVYINTDVKNDYVRFTIHSTGMFTKVPTIHVTEGKMRHSIDPEALDLYKYTGSYAPSSSHVGRRQVYVEAEINGKPTAVETEFDLYSIPPGKAGSFVVNPSGLKISYDSGAVYKPLHMQIVSEGYRSSVVYMLEPQNQLLNRGLTVSVPYEPKERGDNAGLYFRSTGGWIFQTSQPDPGGNSFSTKLSRTLGELAVLEDSQPPGLSGLRILPRKGKAHIAFRYSDNLSGVDTDQIKMYIDGTLVIPEIDGEHRRVWYDAEEPLGRGKHSLRIIARDRMRNETTISRSFTVQ